VRIGGGTVRSWWCPRFGDGRIAPRAAKRLDELEATLATDRTSRRVDTRETLEAFFPGFGWLTGLGFLLLRLDAEEKTATLEVLPTLGVGEQAVISDAVEAIWTVKLP
jgi:hypothetical protein